MQSRACPSCLKGVQRWLSKEAAAGNAPKGLSGIACPAWGRVGTSSEVPKVWRPQLQPGWAPVALRDSLWFPQLGQSMLNKLNKVCGGKNTKEKLQENPAHSPSCQVQQLPTGCVHCHILLRPRTHSKPVPPQARAGTAPPRDSPKERGGIPWADPEVASDRLL